MDDAPSALGKRKLQDIAPSQGKNKVRSQAASVVNAMFQSTP